jgi:hypothetical protein
VIFVGDDWAEDHHDIEIVDEQGRRLAQRRLPEGVEGLAGLHALVADQLGAGDDLAEAGDPAQVIVGIETDRGPWVQALVGAGYRVYAVNPVQVARYRERHGTSGAKSDPGDAHVLAELVRLDRAHHRPLAPDSATAEQVKVLARAHQNLVWARQRQANALRSMLREYYPAALAAFGTDSGGLVGRDALAVLTLAPGPEQGRALSLSKIEAALRRAGRRRYLRVTAQAIQAALRSPQLPANPAVVPAYTASAAAMLAVLAALAEQERPPNGHRWGVPSDPDGHAVAGSAGAVRALADRLQPASALVSRRNVGADPVGVAGRLRRGRGPGVDGGRRLHDRAGASARRWRPACPAQGCRRRTAGADTAGYHYSLPRVQDHGGQPRMTRIRARTCGIERRWGVLAVA